MSTLQNKIRETEKKIEKKIGGTGGTGVKQNTPQVNAKIVSLRARPIQVAHLCFPVGGVVDQVNVRIGDTVQQFDSGIIGDMLQFPTGDPSTGGDPSLLVWDADGISNYVGQSNDDNGALMFLRAASQEAYAALDQAISARSNAYFAKYADQPTLVQAIQDTYLAKNLPAPILVSKSEHLQNLMQISQQQWQALSSQYQATTYTTLAKVKESLGLTSGSPGVVDHSHSDITTVQPEVDVTTKEPEVDATTSGTGGQNVLETTTTTYHDNVKQTTETYTVNQHMDNQDFVFRAPYSEAQAQYERAQLSLADELFSETMRQQTVQNYQQVLSNELNSLNLGVYRLQIAYLNQFLTAPFTGTVTGVYKQPGEAVRAGETVARLEDNSEVYLTGIVVYPGLIQGRQPPDQPGMTATIQTSLYDAGGTPPTLTGEVLTARGCGDDDTWELVIWYVNDGSGPILPVDYYFDFDNTTISFA